MSLRICSAPILNYLPLSRFIVLWFYLYSYRTNQSVQWIRDSAHSILFNTNKVSTLNLRKILLTFGRTYCTTPLTMKHLTRATLLALTFDIGLAFDRSAAHRHAAARHKHKRESSSVTSSSGQDDSENTNVYSSYPEEQNSSITCVEPTVTVTIDLLSTIVTTTTIMPSFTLSLPSTFATHNASELPAMTSQSSSPSRAVIPTSATSSSLQSIQSSWHSLSTFITSSTTSTRTSSLTYGQPASSQASACPTEIQNKTDMLPYFGFNVVNQKPYQLGTPSTGFKTAQDWVSAFENLKTTFPAMNAVRMYST